MCKDNDLPDDCEQSQQTAPRGVDVERLVSNFGPLRIGILESDFIAVMLDTFR